MEKKSALRRIIVFFGCLITTFILINIIWLLLIKKPYEDLCSKSEQHCTESKFTENEVMAYNTYYDTNKGYGYKIYRPEYLSFVGLTLAIGDDRHTTASIDPETGEIIEKDEPLLILNLVRNMFGKYTIHLAVFDIGGENYDVTINKNLKITDSASMEEYDRMSNIINQNENHLKEIMDYAINMWEIS